MSIEIYRGDTKTIKLVFTTCTNKPLATIQTEISEGDVLTSVTTMLKNAKSILAPAGVLELSSCGGEVEEIPYSAVTVTEGTAVFTVSATAEGDYPVGSGLTVDGGRMPITGGAIAGEIRYKRNSDISIGSVTGTIVDGANGSAEIELTPTITDLDVGTYNFTAIFTDVSGDVHTIVNDSLRIL